MKQIDDFIFNRKKALENRKYLKKGIYVLLPNMRTYVRLGRGYAEVRRTFPQGSGGVKQLIYSAISLLFGFVVWESGAFLGEILYFSTISNTVYRDCKVFAPERNKLLILCANRVRYELYMKNRARNEVIFPIPTLYEADPEKLQITEEYISSGRQNNKTIEAVRALFEFYTDYYRTSNRRGTFIYTKDHLSCLCPDILPADCPVLYLHHADLSADNFIYLNLPERKFVFIDFDHEDYYPPFYDVLFLIYNQAFSYSDDVLLNALDAGAFDEYFVSYAAENGALPTDALKNSIIFLWHKRLLTYSSDKLALSVELFRHTWDCAARRFQYATSEQKCDIEK